MVSLAFAALAPFLLPWMGMYGLIYAATRPHRKQLQVLISKPSERSPPHVGQPRKRQGT